MIIDITPPISTRLREWPGDVPFSRTMHARISDGDPVNLSSVALSLHCGAHVDAPSHYGDGGRTIDEQDLDLYVGDCQVIRIPATPGMAIRPEDLPGPIEAERVLFATGTFPDQEVFPENFAALTPELISHLAARGVRLVGIDTPGVDLYAAEELRVHLACLEHDVAILERVWLEGVDPGRYELIALPLRIEGADGSPVRAILRTP